MWVLRCITKNTKAVKGTHLLIAQQGTRMENKQQQKEKKTEEKKELVQQNIVIAAAGHTFTQVQCNTQGHLENGSFEANLNQF